jgi:hypothetical protein
MVDAPLAFFLTAGQPMIWKVPTRFCPRCRPTLCWPTRLSMPMSASSSPCSRQENRPKAIERSNALTKEMYKARYLMENFSFKLKQYRSDRDPI